MDANFKSKKLKWMLNPREFHFQVMYPAFCDLNRTQQYIGAKIKEDLEKLNKSAISVYIHIPWCYGKCSFCFYYRSSNMEEEKEKYFQVLKDEMTWYKKKLDKGNIKIKSVYIGGGTPSILSKDDVEKLWKEIAKPLIEKNEIKEITVEFHPDSFIGKDGKITEESVKGSVKKWEKFQPCRVSVGIQSLIEENLKLIRGENYHYHKKNVEIIIEALNKLMKEDKTFLKSYNLDFMWGLRDTDVSAELKNLQGTNNYCKVPSYTFYQIWAPHDIESLSKYRKEIEWDYNKIISQRKYIFDWMKKNGYKPYWYPHYFVREESDRATDYSSIYIKEEAEGYYIGMGVDAHSKLPSLTYNNESSLKEYIKIAEKDGDGEIPPVRYYCCLDEHEQKKRNFLLSLRNPTKEFKEEDIKKFLELKDEDITILFKENSVGKQKLSDNGMLYVNELIRMASLWNVTPQLNFILTKVENYIKSKSDISDDVIQNIINDIVFWVARYLREEFGYDKIGGVDIGYRSPVRMEENNKELKMFWGEPVKEGFNPSDWEKLLKKFKNNQSNEYFISLTDLISRQTSEHYCFEDEPVKISGKDFGKIKPKSNFCEFKKIFDTLLKNRSIFLKEDVEELKGLKEEAFEKNYSAITASWPIWKFLGLKNNYYMVVVKLPSSLYGNIGGLNFVFTSKPKENEFQKLRNILSNFILVLDYLSETEYNLENKKHALRSAVGAIMARNMSHNIGSHVLNYLSNPEELDKLWII